MKLLFFLLVVISLSSLKSSEASGICLKRKFCNKLQLRIIVQRSILDRKRFICYILEDHPDCTIFKEECQALCLEQSGGVISAQCWGDPLYCYCKASDGTVFHIDGFVCEHPDCPPDA